MIRRRPRLKCIIVWCRICGTIFIKIPRDRRKFCSDECSREAKRLQQREYKTRAGIIRERERTPVAKFQCLKCRRWFKGSRSNRICPTCTYENSKLYPNYSNAALIGEQVAL